MTKQQKLVLIISVLASFVAFLDGSVVNVALPAIANELGGGLAAQQWVVDGYLITLGALILLAGSLSDLFGRKRILIWGLCGFAVASLLCALAPNAVFLIAGRMLQGVAGALLVPSSLALIIASFTGSAQGKAIGSWTAWTGISFIVGPLVGGFLVDAGSWRLIFAINIVPIAITLWLLTRLKQPERTKESAHIDWIGAILAVFGLGLSVYALIEQPNYGWGTPGVYLPFVVGVVLLLLFVLNERRTPQPMLPLSLFRVRNFTVGNIATISIYAGLAIATFLLVIFLQQVGKYSALMAGMALLPTTIIMFFLSPRFGALAGKFGPRLFMALGPIIGGLGFLLMLRVGTPVQYWSEVFPAVLVFSLGLACTVAPLTSAVLGDVAVAHAGVASAVNNAVARIAGLVAIAVVGVVTGPQLALAGFHRAVALTAFLMIIGGVISAIGIVNRHKSAEELQKVL